MTDTIEVLIPPFGQGLDEALLTAVLVEVGAQVQRGTPLAEVETAKSTVEILAERSGVVAEWLIDKGAIVESGEVLCRLEAATD